VLGEVLPRPALAQDLDGDAVPELLAFGNPDDIGQAGALVRAYEWGGAAGWSPRWEFSTDGVADLDGAALAGPDSWTSGEFDGAPGTDLAFAVLRRPSPSLVFLSGVDGSLVASVPRAAIPFGVARPVAIDLVDALGVAGTDGIDEVVQPGTQHIELVSPLTGSVLRRELRYYTTATAVLAREPGVAVTVVEGLHGNVTSNPFGAMEFGIDGIEQRWGPQEVPIPYGRPTLVSPPPRSGDPPLRQRDPRSHAEGRRDAPEGSGSQRRGGAARRAGEVGALARRLLPRRGCRRAVAQLLATEPPAVASAHGWAPSG
jgi:hypothetical protein